MNTIRLRRGTTRTVLVIGPFVIKFARSRRGSRCNRYEADCYNRQTDHHRRELLCPVLWCSQNGWTLVARAATPARVEEQDLIIARIQDWDYHPNDLEDPPFEPKIVDWGWLDGRLVALDYAVDID